jgi:hypothetical protein
MIEVFCLLGVMSYSPLEVNASPILAAEDWARYLCSLPASCVLLLRLLFSPQAGAAVIDQQVEYQRIVIVVLFTASREHLNKIPDAVSWAVGHGGFS